MEIHTIRAYTSINKKNFHKNISYLINYGDTNELEILVKVNPLKKSYSSQIIDESSSFQNGFKVVKMANKEYAYFSLKENKLLPYRYDFASDFNDYGLAIIGKDGRVSWINQNFEYLNFLGLMAKDPLAKYLLDGYNIVYNFKGQTNPLAKLVFINKNGEHIITYLEPNQKIKTFYLEDGTMPKRKFSNGTEFNNDYALADGNLLHASGYYTNLEEEMVLKRVKHE